MRRVSRWILPLIVLLTLIGVGSRYGRQRWEGPGPLTQTTVLVVPHGDTRHVGEVLANAGIIDSVLAFRVAERVTESDGALHTGEFAFPAFSSLRDVMGILRHGRQVEHHLTIPEGLTAQQIVALIDQAPAMTGRAPTPDEGAILPNTYDYLYGTSRETLLHHAEVALAEAVAPLWAARAPDLPLDSARQAVILASIVERETAIPAERAMVAAVYLNRLRAGMKLQADPTVIYAATKGSGALDRPLVHADLLVPDPYNTYLNTGLPPGPIAAPGIAAIAAVLRPATTDALYFVADGTGGHVFSHDYGDQVKNVAKLRKHSAKRD